ncbi:MAG: hypothetical protein J6T29_00440 [Alphaproteobacteria bacterium]|nr:hypothetical protein [Alphaproteobacteria bacterium]
MSPSLSDNAFTLSLLFCISRRTASVVRAQPCNTCPITPPFLYILAHILLPYNLGLNRFKNVLSFSVSFALSLSAVLTGICYFFVVEIVRAFLTDAAAFEFGLRFAQILLTTSFLFGVYFVLVNTLQAMGAATESLIVNLSRQGLLFIPLMFIMEAELGMNGLIWTQPLVDILSLLLAIALFISIYRKMSSGSLSTVNH